jgi:hypothetical protein
MDELNRPDALLAVSTSWSGCAPFTGDCGDGGVALRVSPDGPAWLVPGSAGPGEIGVSELLEQATADARRATAVQATKFLYCIRNDLCLFLVVPTGNGRANSTTSGRLLSQFACYDNGLCPPLRPSPIDDRDGCPAGRRCL